MTPEETSRAIITAASNTTAVHVTGFNVSFNDGIVRLAGVEQAVSDGPFSGRGAWVTSYTRIKELHALLGNLIEQVDLAAEKSKATQQ